MKVFKFVTMHNSLNGASNHWHRQNDRKPTYVGLVSHTFIKPNLKKKYKIVEFCGTVFPRKLAYETSLT
jgi:hypothetical protein